MRVPAADRVRTALVAAVVAVAALALMAPAAFARAGSGSSHFGGGGGSFGGGHSFGGGGGSFGGGHYYGGGGRYYGGGYGHYGSHFGGLAIGVLVGGVVLVVAVIIVLILMRRAVRRAERWTDDVRRRPRTRRTQLAAAEAAEDDAAFAPDTVVPAAQALFADIQRAWDTDDRERLATLVGPDLMVEWRRRLDDFARRGLRNRVRIVDGPAVDYVGLVNREADAEDRVTVFVRARLEDRVESSGGWAVGGRRTVSEVGEYWTLAKRDGRWTLLSIEQRREGRHHLHEQLVATPWADTDRLRDEALVEAAVGDAPAADAAEIADLDFEGSARAAALDLSVADPRFAPDVLEVAARRAVAAWTEAVDGDDRALQHVAAPAVVSRLLHPGDPTGRTRLVVRGARVERMTVTSLDAAAAPPRMTLEIELSGRRYIEDRDTAAVVAGSPDRETRFRERWTFGLDGPADEPWRIAAVAADEPSVAG